MVTLNSIFGSNMIMQANAPVRLFGSGDGNVAITFNGERREATSNGEWLIEFDAVDYGGPYDIMVELGGIFSTLKNVYFGDVILLGGQSNMQFKLRESSEPLENYKGNENVRLFTVDRMENGESFSSRDGWIPLKPHPSLAPLDITFRKGWQQQTAKLVLLPAIRVHRLFKAGCQGM